MFCYSSSSSAVLHSNKILFSVLFSFLQFSLIFLCCFMLTSLTTVRLQSLPFYNDRIELYFIFSSSSFFLFSFGFVTSIRSACCAVEHRTKNNKKNLQEKRALCIVERALLRNGNLQRENRIKLSNFWFCSVCVFFRTLFRCQFPFLLI